MTLNQEEQKTTVLRDKKEAPWERTKEADNIDSKCICRKLSLEEELQGQNSYCYPWSAAGKKKEILCILTLKHILNLSYKKII